MTTSRTNSRKTKKIKRSKRITAGRQSDLMPTNAHTRKSLRASGIGDIMKTKKHTTKKNKTKSTKKKKTTTRKSTTRKTTKKHGYVIKGDKIYYRTKLGKEGSMPKGHTGMVKNWGLQKRNKL